MILRQQAWTGEWQPHRDHELHAVRPIWEQDAGSEFQIGALDSNRHLNRPYIADSK